MPVFELQNNKEVFLEQNIAWKEECIAALNDIATPACMNVMKMLIGDVEFFVGQKQSMLYVLQDILYVHPTCTVDEICQLRKELLSEDELFFVSLLPDSASTLLNLCEKEGPWFAANIGSLMTQYARFPEKQQKWLDKMHNLCFHASLSYISSHREESYREVMLPYSRNLTVFEPVENDVSVTMEGLEISSELTETSWYKPEQESRALVCLFRLQELIKHPPKEVQEDLTKVLVDLLRTGKVNNEDEKELRKVMDPTGLWMKHHIGKAMRIISECIYGPSESHVANMRKLLRFLSTGPTGMCLKVHIALLQRIVWEINQSPEDKSAFMCFPEAEILWILSEQYALEADFNEDLSSCVTILRESITKLFYPPKA